MIAGFSMTQIAIFIVIAAGGIALADLTWVAIKTRLTLLGWAGRAFCIIVIVVAAILGLRFMADVL
jgi:hypothetical protein